jgi:hypothetical protein
MGVVVDPETFGLVLFDAAEIATTLTDLLERLGLDVDLRVEVDEASPLARISAEPGDPVLLRVDGGAFEDTRRPRHLSGDAVVTSAGRALLRLTDRQAGFADAPADQELSLAQVAAWDTWSVARLGRLGYPVNRQRWLYNFRNRHGFTDEADRVFDEVWAAENLTWAQLSALSDRALAARLPA